MPITTAHGVSPCECLPQGLPKDVPLWEKIAQTKCARLEAAIPPEWRLHPGQVPDDQLNVVDVPVVCGLLTDRELDITNCDAVKLVQKLIHREYSSYEVNCLSEIFFERALETARLLDAEYAATGRASGPLHGLPISLKDCFQIEGTDATIGYTAFANQPSSNDEESEITKILRESGAILFCKTNVPLALMAGFLLDDGIVKPLPPVTRALLETKAALEATGHTVIEFHLDDPLFTETLKFALYRSAAAELLSNTLAKTQEPWPRGFDMFEGMVNKTKDVNGENPIDGQPIDRSIRPAYKPASVFDLWEAQVKRTDYAKRMLQSWAATKTRTETGREIDALLMPCTPWPASPKYGFTYDNYASLWNVLDYCATTIPVTHVSLVDDVKPAYEARNDVEARIWEDCMF
ncbi:hypothetical protein DV737_g5244, partial [Chaetothyriales sp. CBS 132003]